MLFNYTYAELLALSTFTFVISITPGPNNVMLLHSGARFGFNPTIPHMLGISFGVSFMIFLCCMGIAGVVLHYPATDWALKIIGSLYMLWLSYKLWRNGAMPSNGELPDARNRTAPTPLTFTQATLFQFVNPKTWMIALTLSAVYLPKTGSIWFNSALACILCAIINLASISVWTRGGELLQSVLHKPRLAKLANIAIVLMTVYCALSVWL